MLELNLFLADCKDFDEDVARYVKTKCETKRKNKTAMTFINNIKTVSRPNDRFGLNLLLLQIFIKSNKTTC